MTSGSGNRFGATNMSYDGVKTSPAGYVTYRNDSAASVLVNLIANASQTGDLLQAWDTTGRPSP